ncbi:general stress protein [Amycolatopsis regifaucium]|uniref:DUF4199 domain-containing protein n=1 Tax=Amycolatopsis regifaucium TaxID=546365 RepID=A0A154MJ12_9PSEU|nr:general stress protein [Amycolatopsis regifaucium]KZB84316.1 hypothetical protein AVL48_33565 [Amycolatopsis regifaucium]OKA03292.1 DUF4199 domain-containing protein [Amycolatopsis regifaucium]SFJ69508.1 hypothetical protein SAMN04489731_13116 [Amycolatopsis regifaucium]
MTTYSPLREPAAVQAPPTGWPIGVYGSYAEAQRAVEYLAGHDFPVQDVTIVGVEPMVVERVTARLSWGRVLAGGAASGAWFGLFLGLLLGLFGHQPVTALIPAGLATGVLVGVASAAIGYASVKGQRDFATTTQVVARRYDVLCEPRNAEKGRDLLAKLALAGPPGQGERWDRESSGTGGDRGVRPSLR